MVDHPPARPAPSGRSPSPHAAGARRSVGLNDRLSMPLCHRETTARLGTRTAGGRALRTVTGAQTLPACGTSPWRRRCAQCGAYRPRRRRGGPLWVPVPGPQPTGRQSLPPDTLSSGRISPSIAPATPSAPRLLRRQGLAVAMFRSTSGAGFALSRHINRWRDPTTRPPRILDPSHGESYMSCRIRQRLDDGAIIAERRAGDALLAANWGRSWRTSAYLHGQPPPLYAPFCRPATSSSTPRARCTSWITA